MADTGRIEELKAEGNSLHSQKKYREAYNKFTEAIELAPDNAILHCNRAAASMTMNDYLNACTDAEKAVSLDPTYYKAWARLARASYALSSWTNSIKAYENALANMPSHDESPAIKTLKKQCREGLDSARQMRNRPIENAQLTEYTIETANEAPIGRARAMQQELRRAESFKSSAWALIYASDEYQKGVRAMVNMPSYVQRGIKPTAISCLCSAVMSEQRGVTIILDDAWQSLYNRQMIFEMRASGAWPGAGAKKVLEEASERLRTSAWDSVRPALDVTVKSWIVTGFQHLMLCRFDTAVAFYRSAFDVLTSGQDIWKDVSPADRGHIFDMTFVRGVKRAYMLALFEAFASGGKLNSAYKFEEILQLAHEIIAEVKANPPEPGNTYDPAFVCSFWDNTLGDAYSMLGYHNLETGQLPSMKAKKARKHFMEAAKYYLQAAEAYPKDDERHVEFLSVAIQAYWRRGTPLRLTHLLSKRMCEDKALAEGIWLTQLTTKVSWIVEKVVEFKEECDKAIAKGKMNLDDVVQPECMNSVEDSPGVFSLYKGIYHWKWKVYKTR